MAYQYRFVDVLARGLENAANRAERAEAARVQQEQFGQQMSQRKKEFDALQELREKADERAAAAAKEETKYRQLNYELQVDKAIQDMIQFDVEQENAMEAINLRLENALEIAKQGDSATTDMIDVATLPPDLRDSLKLPEGTTQVSSKVLPIYNTYTAALSKAAAVDPNSLSKLTDEQLESIANFTIGISTMDANTALAMGVKVDDIGVMASTLQTINAERERRNQAQQ